jgi:hypothetical protein
MIALIAVCETYRRAALPATAATSDTMTASEATMTADLCLTPGCIGTPAHIPLKKNSCLKLRFCLRLNRRKVFTWLEKVCGNFDVFLFTVFLEFVRLVLWSHFCTVQSERQQHLLSLVFSSLAFFTLSPEFERDFLAG